MDPFGGNVRLLITGAGGQLGRALHAECLRQGLPVTALDHHALDIADRDAVRACVQAVRPTAILNCAAFNDVNRAEQAFEEACLANATGPGNLAIAAATNDADLVHFSTDYVFGGEKTTPYRISDAPSPVNRYGRSKRLGEEAVLSLAQRVFVVRLSWVFGLGRDNFVTRMLALARQNQVLRVVTDQVSCPSYAADLAPAILDLLRTGAYGLYQMTCEDHCSRYAWVREIVSTTGLTTVVEPVDSSAFPDEARRPRFSAMDPFPLPTTIGREIPPWRTAVRRYLSDLGALR